MDQLVRTNVVDCRISLTPSVLVSVGFTQPVEEKVNFDSELVEVFTLV